MKLQRLFVLFLTLIVSACSAIVPASTPTPVPLPPAQHVESAFQWLETHAMMSGNVDWTALRDETARIIANAQSITDTYPALFRRAGGGFPG